MSLAQIKSLTQYLKDSAECFSNKDSLGSLDDAEFLEARLARFHGYALVQCSAETHMGNCINQITPDVVRYSSGEREQRTEAEIIKDLTDFGWDVSDLYYDTAYGADNLYAKCPIHKGHDTNPA